MDNRESKERQKGDTDEPLHNRNSDATSKDRLKDIQESEQNDGSSTSDPEPVPSPDGFSDENSEAKDAGPM